MVDAVKRPKVPQFDPTLGGPWDGHKRPPVDPGTNRAQSSRRCRQFAPYGRGHASDGETIETHEERLTRQIGGAQ